MTFVVGLGGFAHCIATSGEVLAAVLTHHAAWTAYPLWFLPAVSGNICGGVLMVTVLEYGQVIYGGDASTREERDAPTVKVPVEQLPQFSGVTADLLPQFSAVGAEPVPQFSGTPGMAVQAAAINPDTSA